jgi:hypothetical protein
VDVDTVNMLEVKERSEEYCEAAVFEGHVLNQLLNIRYIMKGGDLLAGSGAADVLEWLIFAFE